MYEFTNTNSTGSGTVLPTEAVKFDGEWLDLIVPGFRTLSVRGRESYLRNITDESDISLASHGRRFINSYYESRSITVKFQLNADSSSGFRDCINKLHKALVPAQKELIFNDELDKFYIATCNEIPEFNEGSNHVIGEIVFYCSDPCKYSKEYTAESIKTNSDIVAVTDDITPAIITVTTDSNLEQLTINGLSRNKVTKEAYPIVIRNLLAGIPVTINGETGMALQNNSSKFIDNELVLKTFPTLLPGDNTVRIIKSSSAVGVTVNIKYRSLYV